MRVGAIVLCQTPAGPSLLYARPWSRSLPVFSHFLWPQNPRCRGQYCDFCSANEEAEIQRISVLSKVTKLIRDRLRFGPRFAGLQRLSS